MAAFQWGKFSRKAYRSIVESVARLNFWEGSVRSGKTISSIVRWLDFVRTAPTNGRLLMVGRTQGTLKRNIIDPILDMVGKDAHYNRGTGELHLFGRVVDTMGASDERAQEKIRGATIAGAYGDEVTLWPESFFKMLLSRLSVRGAKFFGTTNPDSPYHWLKVEYLERARELGIRVFHFTLDDNPNLDPDYVKALKREYTGLWFKRFILGLWVLADGVVFDMFDEARHVVDVAAILAAQGKDRFDRYFVACDYGTSNPCTFGLYGYNAGKPPVYLVKEYYYDSAKKGRQKTDGEYADDLKVFLGDLRPVALYVDPSAASFITELGKRGLNVTPADNDVLNGIRFVGNMLTQAAFLVDKGCTHTIQEFGGYLWDAKAQKRGEDKPLKERDHAMDRNRYGLYTHFKRAGIRYIGFNLD
jgi:PBSX family phage terminase large subunit